MVTDTRRMNGRQLMALALAQPATFVTHLAESPRTPRPLRKQLITAAVQVREAALGPAAAAELIEAEIPPDTWGRRERQVLQPMLAALRADENRR